MQKVSFLLLIAALLHSSLGYVAQNAGAGGYSSGYSSSRYSSSSSSSSASSASGGMTCCSMSSWGYNHMREVREFANRVRSEYNVMSRGGSAGQYASNTDEWSASIIDLTGKTASELDAICRQVSQQLVEEMRVGSLSYETISNPSFFDWKAADYMQNYVIAGSSNLQQQQENLDLGHVPLDVSHYDEIRNVAYPAEVQVIGGKTYVVHKNCTEAQKHGSMPAASYGPNNGFSSGSYTHSYPAPGATVYVRKQTIKDWVTENMEPRVVGYQATRNLDNRYTAGNSMGGYSSGFSSYAQQQSSNSYNKDFDAFTRGGAAYQPGSTVTIRRFNKTIITNPDGSNTVRGSESNKKWVDGKLVYDNERPFGEWSVARDDNWKREERERFYWFLTQGASTVQQLEQWQRQQEERLIALSQRYNISLQAIHEFHRKELERYRVLLGQYQAQTNDAKAWQRMERGRLDWLIHQNSVTKEELAQWQRENYDKLRTLAQQYNIPADELISWQEEELHRLYIYFNDQNNSMMPAAPNSGSLRISEQERLEELIRQHNATIEQLHNSIKLDQQKLSDLSHKYKGNVQDMEKWLKEELARLGGIMHEQRNEMTRITEWQRSERQRLENMAHKHKGSVGDFDAQIAQDHAYLQTLANKYKISIEELEKWQRSEIERIQSEGHSKLEADIKMWQLQERARLTDIIKKNDLSMEEFQSMILNDRARLNNLAQTYKLQVSEVEQWINNEIKNFQSQGLLKEVQKELAVWQQKERERLQVIVEQNHYSVEEIERKVQADQQQLQRLANTYKIEVSQLEQWLKTELQRLQKQGLIKAEDLQQWQKQERDEIMKIVYENKLTLEQFEQKLLQDRSRLGDLARSYNVETTELESWIKKEGERLQSMGLLQVQEQLNNWQKAEHDRLLLLIGQNNLTITELEQKLKNDQVHLYALAHKHQVRVEEIEEWIKQEIKKLQQEGLLEIEKLKDWQTEWRGNLTNMVMERDLTVEEFHKWLLEDRQRLQTLAMQHNVQIEEIEQWIQNEEKRFVSMGLLKPNEKLTNWQEVERRYLERITQEQYHSTEQLEQRLRQDREMLEKLAHDYSVQVEEVEMWMKKELARLRDDGQLQIDNLTAWQLMERERLEELSKQNKQWSAEEYATILRQDREQMQKMAFQYHTTVEEIEKWVQSEIERLRQQGKLDVEKLTQWQKTEHQRILNLLQQQSGLTVEEFERKVEKDRNFVVSLANQYHISVVEVEEYVKQVIEDLRKQGKLELEKLQAWQRVEREYIKEQIAQFQKSLPTKEYESKLLEDRVHLQQLSQHYNIDIKKIEEFMLAELRRLRTNSQQEIDKLSAWQQAEFKRLQGLVQQNSRLTFVDYQVELMKDRKHLQQLSEQYSVSVAEIENWLRQQLVNLKSTGQLQVESLTKWQEGEQQRLIDQMLQQQRSITTEEFERQIRNDRMRLQKISEEHNVSVEQIEKWMQEELNRLKDSGLVQIEQLTFWQKMERERLKEWLQKQNNDVSFEQLQEFLQRDKERLQRISNDYKVTVSDVESWIQKECARLQLINSVHQPNGYIYSENINTEHSWNNNPQQQHQVIVDVDNNEELWKTQTRAHLQAIAQVKPMTWQQFEQYLKNQRNRWQQFAQQYDITVEEIEYWLRESAKDLARQGLIENNVVQQEWEKNEQIYIDNLINDRLRKQMQWSIDELEIQLRNNRNHLNEVSNRYQISIEEIEEWYKLELQRLLAQRRITDEDLMDWQRREKERIYITVQRQPTASIQVLEEMLFRDKNNLADLYHVRIEELEMFIRSELLRLQRIGLIAREEQQNSYNNWQQLERMRLHTIARDIIISEEELLEFIADDNGYKQQLSSMYGCGLDQLATFQRTEIANMQQSGFFDNTKLLAVTYWQREERNRLYEMIKNQNMNRKTFEAFQRQMHLLNGLAQRHGISVQELLEWQKQEFTRLEQLALYYKMTLNQLQNFREKELRNINYVMHKKTTSDEERRKWESSEASRMAALQRKTGLSGQELIAWRRRLYLLCQGRLPFDFGGSGGFETGEGSTNRTAIPRQIISKDRGDQPPNVYEDNFEGEEPGVAGQDPLYPPPSAQIKEEPTTLPPTPSVQPYLPPHQTPMDVQSSYRYYEKKYKYRGPIATASASSDMNGSSASASVASGLSMYDAGQQQQESDDFGGMQSDSLTRDEQQQQVEDFGQQQQVELDWNGKLQQQEDFGQQQMQVEDVGGLSGGYQSHGNYHAADLGQQQQMMHEDYYAGGLDHGQQQMQQEQLPAGLPAHTGYSEKQMLASSTEVTAQAEVTAEPEAGFFKKIKNKWFG